MQWHQIAELSQCFLEEWTWNDNEWQKKTKNLFNLEDRQCMVKENGNRLKRTSHFTWITAPAHFIMWEKDLQAGGKSETVKMKGKKRQRKKLRKFKLKIEEEGKALVWETRDKGGMWTMRKRKKRKNGLTSSVKDITMTKITEEKSSEISQPVKIVSKSWTTMSAMPTVVGNIIESATQSEQLKLKDGDGEKTTATTTTTKQPSKNNPKMQKNFPREKILSIYRKCQGKCSCDDG